MALLKCEDCGRDVSSKATACPHCGCPVPAAKQIDANQSDQNRSNDLPSAWKEPAESVAATPPPQEQASTNTLERVLPWLGGLILLVLLVRACSGPGDDTSGQAEASTPSSSTASKVEEPAKEPAPPPGPSEADKSLWASRLEDETASAAIRLAAAEQLQENFPQSEEGKKAQGMIATLEKSVAYENMGRQWDYSSSKEGMSGKSVRTARVQSTNTINLDFPYSGEQHATLLLRRHPRWGNDLIVRIEQGQILCNTYDDCSVNVRFDDGKVLRYQGTPPGDNSSEAVFIPAFSTFLKKLPSTKTVKVEISLYQAGNRVFEFDVSGFKPENFK